MRDDFVTFILSHRRADHVKTVRTLERCGYTGDWRIIIDDEDGTADEYMRRYPGRVIVFSKSEVAKKTDAMDNFGNHKTILYARNACFDIAAQLGKKFFLELDDDYIGIEYHCRHTRHTVEPKNLDTIFGAYVEFLENCPQVLTIAMAQSGDFTGGDMSDSVRKRWRKAMNSFFCTVERPFQFRGSANEDVNTYVDQTGGVILTHPFISIRQIATQKNRGGLTDVHKTIGTYVKSMYTVMCAPAAAITTVMPCANPRPHHRISWRKAMPCILPERYRKP